MSNNRYDFNFSGDKGIDVKLKYITNSTYGGDWHSTLHTHHFTELFYITNGKGGFIVEDTTLEVKEHDLIIINPKVQHTEVSMRKWAMKYIVLGVEGLTFLFDEDDERQEYNVYNYQSQKKTLEFFFRLLFEEIQEKPEKYEHVCQNILEVLLIHIMRHSDSNFSIISSQKGSKECAMVKRYIETHFKEKITLDLLAEIVHMNKFYLAHAFSECYNISPINYLIDCRIQESKTLLLETDHSLSQISNIVGFSSPSYFSQSFKKATGTTAAAYRSMKG